MIESAAARFGAINLICATRCPSGVRAIDGYARVSRGERGMLVRGLAKATGPDDLACVSLPGENWAGVAEVVSIDGRNTS